MLEISIFVQKDFHQSFSNRKAGNSQNAMGIPENQTSRFNLILSYLLY